jgi:exodeoxyribonuclease VII large subunit
MVKASKEQSPVGLFELNRQIWMTIQSGFPESVWVIGEISDFSVNRNGHCYLELIEKEEEGDKIIAKMRATIWSSAYRMIRPFFESSTGQELMPGIKVLVRADIEFHELYSLSLNIRDIEPSFTIGDQARKRQMIIRKLEEQGFMEMNKELELPLVPQKIAIISSPTAAGYGDFWNQLSTNPGGYMFYTKLFPAVMQGEETGPSVISALDQIAAYGDFFEAVVIIRGGGSKLDLSSFDQYDLALNVAQFPLPVITGIGHEQDDSIVDLVAHTRCKTPTAVAEFLIGRAEDFEARLDLAAQSAILAARSRIQSEKALVTRLADGLRLRVGAFTGYRQLALTQFRTRCENASRQFLRTETDRLVRWEQLSTLKDPVNILKMGYSITLKDGKAIRSVTQVESGDSLVTRLADGSVTSTVN